MKPCLRCGGPCADETAYEGLCEACGRQITQSALVVGASVLLSLSVVLGTMLLG